MVMLRKKWNRIVLAALIGAAVLAWLATTRSRVQLYDQRPKR